MQNNNQNNMPPQLIFPRHLIDEGREMIRKSHFRKPYKVVKYWQDNPNISDIASRMSKYGLMKVIEIAKKEEIKKTVPKDHNEKDYFVPIFSQFRGSYQMDLLEQSSKVNNQLNGNPKNAFPKYYMVLLNINTHYAFVYPQAKKNIQCCLRNFSKFLNEPLLQQSGGVQHIMSDEEKAFKSQNFVQFLNNRGIGIKFNSDQKHTALSLIDRFIRILRDMNTPTTKNEFSIKHRQSDNSKYRDFSIYRMRKLLKIYNESPILIKGYTQIVPIELMQSADKEEDYILFKLFQREEVLTKADWKLKVNTKVRFIVMNYEQKKRRFLVTPEHYVIVGKEGFSYILQSATGQRRTFSRWRLVPLQPGEDKIYAPADNFPQMSSYYEVAKISDFDVATQKYQVYWTGWKDPTWEPISNIRLKNPNQRTEAEKAFWNSNKGRKIWKTFNNHPPPNL